MLQFQERIKKLRKAIFERPRHFHVMSSGDTVQECLRVLERRSSLPSGDLSVSKHPRQHMVASLMFDVWMTGLESKISERWRTEGKGYVSGHISEPFERTELFRHRYYGILHVSENCPGVFEDGVCRSCGYQSP